MGGLVVAAPCASMLLWPWMLPWLFAVAVPVVLAWWALRHARLVRWGAIDLVARAARAAGIGRGGLPWLLTAVRMLLVASVVIAATRPFVGRPPAHGEPIVAGDLSQRIEIVRRDEGGRGSLLAVERAVEALAKAPRESSRVIAPAVHAVTIRDAARPSTDRRVIMLGDDLFPLPAADAMRIAALVREGASLLVCLGPGAVGPSSLARVSSWLDDLAGVQVVGTMAIADELVEVVDAGDSAGSQAGDPAGFQAGDRSTVLPGPRVVRAAEIFFEPGSAVVIARASASRRPLIVEVPVGRGRVCVSAVPLALPKQGDSADTWSDIAVWPSFVPLIDRIVARLLDPVAANGPSARSPRRFAGLPLAWLFLGVGIAAVIAEMILSLRQSAGSGSGSYGWMVVPRGVMLAVLLTMGVAWGGPPRDRPSPPGRDRPVMVLVDVSPSMATDDGLVDRSGTRGTSRLAAVLDAFRGDRAKDSPLDRLSRGRPVEMFWCGPALQPLGRYRGERGSAEMGSLEAMFRAPDGSRVGDAVIDLLDRDPAAIVVATDGAITSGASWPEAAAAASRAGVPLVVIPVGSDDTSSEGLPQGFRFSAADAPAVSRPGEAISIPVRAIASSPVERSLPLRGDGGGGVLSVDSIATPLGYAYAGRHEGVIAAATAGPSSPASWVTQTIEVAAASDGTTGQRHACTVSSIVADDRIRVLLIDAGPRYEFRFLERLLAADDRFAVTTRLLEGRTEAGGRQKVAVPESVEAWSEFDVVVVGDVPIALDWKSLPDAVAREGLGIAWLPGRRWAESDAGAGGWLPAVPPLDPRSSANASSPLRLEVLPSGIASGWFPSVGLASNAAAGLAPTTYSQIPRVAVPPTARVLAVGTGTSGERMPAIVVERLGRGTILGALCDTWRWRDGPALDHGSTPHARFWFHAVARLAEPRRRARLTAAMLVVRPLDPVVGETVRVDLVPTRPSTDLSSWRLEAALADGSARDVSLPSVPVGATATVRLDGLPVGRHRLRLAPSTRSSEEPSSPPIEREIVVNEPLAEVAPAAAGTRPLTAAIEAAGAAVVPLDRIDSLARMIEASISPRRGFGAEAARWFESWQAANVLLLVFLACCVAAWWPRTIAAGPRGDHDG
ncbi:MAG: hypothetical protein ACKOYJ_10005 [Planctomycetia bacterium]